MSWPVRKTTTAKKKKKQKQTKKTHHKTKNTTFKSTQECASFIANISAGFISYPRTVLGKPIFTSQTTRRDCTLQQAWGLRKSRGGRKVLCGKQLCWIAAPLGSAVEAEGEMPFSGETPARSCIFFGARGWDFFFFFFLVWNASWICVSPCVGAMLIFSVWVQFWCMCCWSEHSFVF